MKLFTPSGSQRARAIRTGTVAAVAVLALSSCAAGGGSSADGKTTLTVFSWDTEATMTPVISAFEKAHPDIAVEFSYAPPVSEYVSTLQTRLSSGTAADVFVMAAENKSTLIDNESVMPLTDEPFMENIAAFNRETYSRDGEVYAMSTSTWGAGVFYNKALLEDAGMTSAPATWEEFLDLMEKVESTTGVAPFYDNNLKEIPFSLQALLGSSFDGEPVDENVFDGSETFAEAWSEPVAQWYEQYDRGLVSSDLLGLTGDQVTDEFANGRVAMYITGPWSIDTIENSNPDLDFGIMPLPAPSGQTAVLPGAASVGWSINAATENKEAAAEFLAFVASPEAQSLLQETSSAIITTTDFEPTVDPLMADLVDPIRAGQVYLAQIAWPRYQDRLTTEAVSSIQQLVLDQVGPDAVGASLDETLASR